MSQLQENNASLDCAESRTVRSIPTLRRQNNSQQQQQQCIANTKKRCTNLAIAHCIDDTCQQQTLAEPSKARLQQRESARQRKSCKTKSYVLLPIIFFAILVQSSYATPVTLSGKRLILHTSEYRERQHQELLERERAAYAQPTPTHHRHHLHLRSLRGMSMNGGAANGGGDSDYCQQVVRTLQNTLKQANATYYTLRNYLDTYVQQQYSSQISEVKDMWKLHKLNLNPHPYRNVLEHNFDELPAADEQHFGSIIDEPISEAMISAELVKVYTTLTILDKVFAQLNETRRANYSQLLHDYGQDRLHEINTFFAEASRHVRIELEETKQAMANLRIPEPVLMEPITYNEATPAREWLIATEHLKVVQYLRRLYTILLTKCPAPQ